MVLIRSVPMWATPKTSALWVMQASVNGLKTLICKWYLVRFGREYLGLRSPELHINIIPLNHKLSI